MRQLFSRLAVAPGLLALACATAIEEGGFGAPLDVEEGGSSAGGSLIVGGSGGGQASAGSTSMSGGGKAGSTGSAFGGTATGGGSAGSVSKAGSASGGSGGSDSGGSATAGSSTGGKGNAGSANGGSATAGTANGGSGSAGAPTSTVCDGVPDWTSKTYKLGDSVASTCSGPFAGSCGMGQSHKFECNPMAGTNALPWCMSREPGVGNGWQEAWVDKGQCE